MAAIFNTQRVVGVRIVADGTKLYNNQPVIGVVNEAVATFLGNQLVLGVDVLGADAQVYNEGPVLGVVVIGDGRTLYNNQRVKPARALSGVLA